MRIPQYLWKNYCNYAQNYIKQRLQQIEQQIPEIQGEIDFLKIQYLSSDQTLSEARDIYSQWPKISYR